MLKLISKIILSWLNCLLYSTLKYFMINGYNQLNPARHDMSKGGWKINKMLIHFVKTHYFACAWYLLVFSLSHIVMNLVACKCRSFGECDINVYYYITEFLANLMYMTSDSIKYILVSQSNRHMCRHCTILKLLNENYICC